MMGGSTLGRENSKLCTLAHEVAVEIVSRMRDEFTMPCDTPPPSWPEEKECDLLGLTGIKPYLTIQ